MKWAVDVFFKFLSILGLVAGGGSGYILYTKANEPAPQSIILASPDGKHTIRIEAKDERTGIFITSTNKGKDSSVAIYNDEATGATVTVFGHEGCEETATGLVCGKIRAQVMINASDKGCDVKVTDVNGSVQSVKSLFEKKTTKVGAIP